MTKENSASRHLDGSDIILFGDYSSLPKLTKNKRDKLEDYLSWVVVSKEFFTSTKDFKNRGLHSRQAYVNAFGSIEELVRLAKKVSGLNYPVNNSNKFYSKTSIADELVILANEVGRIPYYSEVARSQNLPSVGKVIKIFGTDNLYDIFVQLQPRLTFDFPTYKAYRQLNRIPW